MKSLNNSHSTTINFVKQLEQLTDKAETFIIEKVKEKGKITLFKLAETERAQIEDDYPEFAYYDRYDALEYAAVSELIYTAWGTVEVTGILKRESFPENIVITLSDFTYEKIIFLAGYLADDENPHE